MDAGITMEGESEGRTRCLVISLGGSIIVPKDDDISLIEDIAALLKEYIHTCKFFLVVGGGRTAREYIGYGRRLGADESFLDDMGIASSRLNAMLMISALGEHAAPEIPVDFNRALELGRAYDIVVMGGTHPGHTTDAVAAMLCERCGGDYFINATTVDGIYDRDPAIHPGAKKLERVDTATLLDMIVHTHAGAGPNVVVDPTAVRIMARSGIPGCVVDGRELRELERAIEGKPVQGTVIEITG